MKRICPTIQQLLAFDAVARYENISLAANILCLSVSGVSKQITGLESFIGKPLLIKKGRSVQLSLAGRHYWAKIAPSLRTIESATFETRAQLSDVGMLNLTCVPTFLTKWLIPRLADFRQRYPGVTFSFSDHLGFHAPQIHVAAAIRYGNGHWENVLADYITGHEFVCIYASSLLSSNTPINTQEALLEQTLLHHDETLLAWREWARCNQVNEMKILPGPRFAQYSALIQAVLSGFGVGLVPRALVEEELADGRLNLFGDVVHVEHGHYLCYAPEQLDQAVFVAFRDWLLGQVK